MASRKDGPVPPLWSRHAPSTPRSYPQSGFPFVGLAAAELLDGSLCEARSSKPRSTALEPILLIVATAAIPLDRVVLAEIRARAQAQPVTVAPSRSFLTAVPLGDLRR
jgi:hypothetical protein